MTFFRTEDEWDCDMDDEWYICGQTEIWVASDGAAVVIPLNQKFCSIERLQNGNRFLFPAPKHISKNIDNISWYNVGVMMPWMNYTPRTLTEIITYEKRFTNEADQTGRV